MIPVGDAERAGEEGQDVAGDGHLRHDVVGQHVGQTGSEIDNAQDVHEAAQQSRHVDHLG